MIRLLFIALWTLLLAEFAMAQSSQPIPHPPIGRVERLDASLDALVPADAQVEVLASGYKWSEGPVWIKDGGYLLFSDVPNNVIMKWKEGEGATEYLKPSGYTGTAPRGGETGSNGLTIDAEGRLVMCQQGDRRVARMDAPLDKPAPNFVTLADRFQGKRLNSPNDLVFHSSGVLFFTDPAYGLEKQWTDPAREIEFAGVHRVGTDGEVTLVTDKLTRPNGIAFSPDEKRLYISQSDSKAPVWMVFDVSEDGDPVNGRVFFDSSHLAEDRAGSPDGMKIDKQGNLFATGPGGVLVIDPSGKHLGTIITGERVANCAFGDDGKTLYMTSNMFLCRIRLSTTGAGF